MLRLCLPVNIAIRRNAFLIFLIADSTDEGIRYFAVLPWGICSLNPARDSAIPTAPPAIYDTTKPLARGRQYRDKI